MNKYNDFIKELRSIRGLKTVNIEYNKNFDSLYLTFTDKQFVKIDNEESKMFFKFKEAVYNNDFEYEFKCANTIEVYEN